MATSDSFGMDFVLRQLVDDSENAPLPDRLWHYTSMTAAKAILEGGGALFATDADYLNDTTELRNYVTPFRRAITDYAARPGAKENLVDIATGVADVFGDMIRTTYVLSFTELTDDLAQWRGYGDDGNGVALVYDQDKLARGSATADGSPGAVFRCIYKDEDQLLQRCLRLLQLADENSRTDREFHFILLQGLELLAPITKSSVYRGEAEVRFFVWTHPRNLRSDDDHQVYSGRKVRQRGITLVPFMPIMPKGALEGVWLGPLHQADRHRSIYGMRSLLAANHMADLPVHVSELSYRR